MLTSLAYRNAEIFSLFYFNEDFSKHSLVEKDQKALEMASLRLQIPRKIEML